MSGRRRARLATRRIGWDGSGSFGWDERETYFSTAIPPEWRSGNDDGLRSDTLEQQAGFAEQGGAVGAGLM